MGQFDLVFEGGGAKGSAFVGALTQLTKAGHTHRRLVGTSAGAITATLLGAGYSPDEMLAAVNETLPGTDTPVFTTFMDAPTVDEFTAVEIDNSETMRVLKMAPLPSFVDHTVVSLLLKVDLYRELFGFVECGGFYSGNAFLSWFKKKLAAKGIDPAITWAKFEKDPANPVVTVVTTDTTDREMVILNSRTAPDAPVAESVRMSMSIPFVWHEMVWQESWGKYRGASKTGHIFVDGGVLSNFPIRLVEETDDDIPAIMGTIDSSAGTIGLLLDESIPADGAQPSDTRRPRLRTADRVTRVIDCMMGSTDAGAIRRYPEKVCHIPVGGYGTTEFRMSKDRLQVLVDSGRKAMEQYLVELDARALAAKVAANSPAAD